MKPSRNTVENTTQDEDRAAFEAFGQSFLAQFGPLPPSKKRKADTQLQKPVLKKVHVPESREEEMLSEGTGSEDDTDSNSDDEIEDEEGSIPTQDDEEEIDPKRAVPVIVFDGRQSAREKRQVDKSFMSSKISKLRQTETKASTSKTSRKEKQEEVELQANDRSLYKLIHTKLLTASLDERSSDMSGAKKKKSLEGRVLEIANAAKLGKGETTVRRKEHSKAPRIIQKGIEAKRRQINEMRVQEAKEAGNYHPMIKKLLKDDDTPNKRIKRERGIGMGVGSFKGGILTLGKHEIRKGQGITAFDSKRGRKSRK